VDRGATLDVGTPGMSAPPNAEPLVLEAPAGSDHSMRDGLNAVFRDRWRIFLAMLVVLALAGLAAWLKTPLYTARTALLVLMSEEYAYRPEGFSGVTAPMMPMERDAIMNSEVSILTSPSLAREVIATVGLERVYPKRPAFDDLLTALTVSGGRHPEPLDLAVERFRRDFRAGPDRSGSTLTVSYRNPDRELAAEVLNTLLTLYQDKRTALYSTSRSDLLQAEVDKARAGLDAISAEMAEYQRREGITDFAMQMELLLNRLGDGERALHEAETEIAATSQRLASARAQVQSTPADVVQYADSDNDRRIQTIRDSIAALRRQESELKQTFTDESPKVVAVLRQIDAMESELASFARTGAGTSSVRRGINQVHTAAQLERQRSEGALAAAEAKRAQLRTQVGSLQSQIRALQAKRTTVESLARQKSVAEQTFLAGNKALQERRITEDILSKKAANVRVIEPARPPARPAATRPAILAAGVLLSLLTGLMVAVLSDRFRKTFLSPERVERELGVPVLAAVADGGRRGARTPALNGPAQRKPPGGTPSLAS